MALTRARLRKALKYQRSTGNFIWLIRPSNRVKVGDVAGTRQNQGYISIALDGQFYLAHRLAWFYVKGEWPPEDVDHKNGNRADNRWRNLRPGTRGQNMQNLKGAHVDSVTGLLGVTPADGRFLARICTGGKTKRLGRFDTPEEAHERYLQEKRKEHEFTTI